MDAVRLVQKTFGSQQDAEPISNDGPTFRVFPTLEARTAGFYFSHRIKGPSNLLAWGQWGGIWDIDNSILEIVKKLIGYKVVN